MRRLLSFAIDGKVDDPVALRAIIAALDRAGLAVTSKVDIDVTPARTSNCCPASPIAAAANVIPIRQR